MSTYPIGTSEYPDRSANLSLPETQAFQDNAALFPLGLDFFFTSGVRIAALLRSTKVSRSSSEAVVQEGAR